MISISHWGMFEVEFKDWLVVKTQRIAHAPTSFFVSRQDRPVDPKLHKFY